MTERHYQRASNHNSGGYCLCHDPLKGIIKEHQITTASVPITDAAELKGIIKEHQITTVFRPSFFASYGKALSKSIKSQLVSRYWYFMLTERHYQRASNHNYDDEAAERAVLKGIIKEHQITTTSGESIPERDGKALSKSIKSQRGGRGGRMRRHGKALSKSIKSQLGAHIFSPSGNGKALSKSIKSQLVVDGATAHNHGKALSKSIKSQQPIADEQVK